jgi:hypothetical protein
VPNLARIFTPRGGTFATVVRIAFQPRRNTMHSQVKGRATTLVLAAVLVAAFVLALAPAAIASGFPYD